MEYPANPDNNHSSNYSYNKAIEIKAGYALAAQSVHNKAAQQSADNPQNNVPDYPVAAAHNY